MSTASYCFPMFDIQGVPFKVDQQTYCYDVFQIVYKDGRSYLDRHGEDVPSEISQIVFDFVEAFYALPKQIRFMFVDTARRRQWTWPVMWEQTDVFIGEQYRYKIEVYTLVFKQMAMLVDGASINQVPELVYWLSKKSNANVYETLKSFQQSKPRVVCTQPKKDWWDRACEIIFGF